MGLTEASHNSACDICPNKSQQWLQLFIPIRDVIPDIGISKRALVRVWLFPDTETDAAFKVVHLQFMCLEVWVLHGFVAWMYICPWLRIPHHSQLLTCSKFTQSRPQKYTSRHAKRPGWIELIQQNNCSFLVHFSFTRLPFEGRCDRPCQRQSSMTHLTFASPFFQLLQNSPNRDRQVHAVAASN